MDIRFTKMQGAGNDFVVLDETQGLLGLSTAQYRFLADRHFGVGADQILSVRPSPAAGLDFEYVIHNADGGEVEHCGNGARCFVRYVHDKGLTDKTTVRVKVQQGEIELRLRPDGRVTVDMGPPVFDLPLGEQGSARVAVLSMGNPHAVQRVDDVDSFPVRAQGPLIEHHPAFPNRVNAGFMQIVSRKHIKLRVFERGAGETLACGTGACAAVVAGIRQAWLDSRVDVHTHGGVLSIEWAGEADSPVLMTGPATTVFDGQIHLPETL
jgi:diaminopimelate epimerase